MSFKKKLEVIRDTIEKKSEMKDIYLEESSKKFEELYENVVVLNETIREVFSIENYPQRVSMSAKVGNYYLNYYENEKDRISIVEDRFPHSLHRANYVASRNAIYKTAECKNETFFEVIEFFSNLDVKEATKLFEESFLQFGSFVFTREKI